jgi:hypothetical protein
MVFFEVFPVLLGDDDVWVEDIVFVYPDEMDYFFIY